MSKSKGWTKFFDNHTKMVSQLYVIKLGDEVVIWRCFGNGRQQIFMSKDFFSSLFFSLTSFRPSALSY